MMVVEAMNRAVVTVEPDQPVATAAALARATGAEHLLVLDEQILVGILCARDLRAALPDEHVCDRMRVPVVTVRPDTPLEDVVETMQACALGCVPVALGGLILGTVTDDELERHGYPPPRAHRRAHGSPAPS